MLKELATPLEIQKFFDAVPTIDRQRFSNPPALIAEAIRLAHRNSIERTVIEQIEARSDIRTAAVIGALLKISDKFSIARLQEIEDRLADKSSDWDRGVLPLVRFFVAARNLRQSDDIVTYYHPRVEAGILQALKGQRIAVGKALRALIEVWVSLEDAGEWGAGAAAKLIAAIPTDSKINLNLRQDITDTIDRWLESNLSNPPGKLEVALELIATAGSPTSAEAEVARYLLNRAPRHGFFIDHWEKPKKDDDWYQRHSSRPETKFLVERFIRDVLPWSHGWYAPDFARDVKRLVPDLTSAFLHAAHQIVALGVTHSDDAIAEGALDDLVGFESVVQAAVEALNQTPEERERDQKLNLALTNGEYSEEYAEHLIDSNEDGYTAGVFLKAYIRRVRKTVGWQHLVAHPYRERLRRYWLEALRDEVKGSDFDDDQIDTQRSDTKLQADELHAAFELAYGSPDEDELWFLLLLAWDERFLQALQNRIKEGTDSSETRHAALTCLLAHAPRKLNEIDSKMEANGEIPRRLEMALDLAQLSRKNVFHRKEYKAAAKAALDQLPAPLRELGIAFIEVLEDRLPAVSEGSRKLLQSVSGDSEDLRRLRLAVGDVTDAVWHDDLIALLTTSEDPDIAVEALSAAIRTKQDSVLRESLTHKFAAVRARALAAIGGELAAPLPSELLSMASDKGQLVRRAATSLLATKIDPSHTPVLIRLAGDKYSTGSHYADDQAVFPIAREAVAAIKAYPQLDRTNARALLEIAISSSDPGLRMDIFKILVTHAGLLGQEIIFDLATEPGRDRVRSQAARAFLSSLDEAAPKVVANITPALLATQIASVAVAMALVLGAYGRDEAIRDAAAELATNRKRRVLVLLLVRLAVERGLDFAQELATLMPEDHPGLKWALGGEIDWKDDQRLSDLGEAGICHEAFLYMKPNKH